MNFIALFEKQMLMFILGIAFIVRLVFLTAYIELDKVNTWEYGEIAQNVINGKGYSLFYFQDDKLEYKFNELSKPFPSAYMPPGYVLLILPFFYLDERTTSIRCIIILQILLSLLVIYYLYLITRQIFGGTTALIAALIYALLPESIYGIASITPTVVFHFMILLIVYRLNKQDENSKIDYFLPILFSILIYFRSEFLFYLVILFSYFLLKKKFVPVIKYSIVILFLLLPWEIRNIVLLDSFVPFTTNAGINLYRGNNVSDVGGWGEEIMAKRITQISRNNQFEVSMNKEYLERAINYIIDKPSIFLINSFRKIFELWGLSLNDARVTNYFYLIPWLIILTFFIVGIVYKYDFQQQKYIHFVFGYFTIISAIFFTLPRYQSMMKILVLPFAAEGIVICCNKIKKWYNQFRQ